MDVEVEATKDLETEVEINEVEDSITDESDRSTIAKSYDSKRKEQLGITDDEEPDDEESDLDEAAELTEPEEVEVIINGNRKMVAKDKVDNAGGVENYQKNVAANMRLQEAADERKQLQIERQNLENYRRELEAKAQQSQAEDVFSDNVPLKSDNHKTLVKQYHDALFEGDDDKSLALFEQLTAAQQQQQVATPNVDVQGIEQRAAQRAKYELTQELRSKEISQAQAEFNANFPDIANDRALYNMADEKTKVLMQQHPNWSPAQIINAAGEEMQEWLSTLGVQQTDDSRTDAKKHLSSVKAAGGRAKAKPQKPVMTRSEYVQNLRVQRGLE